MILFLKSHQILSDYIQILFKKKFKLEKKGIMASEKIRNSDNYIYNYAH